MEENKDLMIQEEEETTEVLDSHYDDGETSGGFGLGALLISAAIGAGAAWLGKKGFDKLRSIRKKKNESEYVDVDEILEKENVDSNEDESE